MIDDAIDVDIDNAIEARELIFKRLDDLIRKLRALDYPHYGTELARVRADIARHQLLMLEILLKALGETPGTVPPSYPHLDA